MKISIMSFDRIGSSLEYESAIMYKFVTAQSFFIFRLQTVKKRRFQRARPEIYKHIEQLIKQISFFRKSASEN